jgi:hypothetical protein
MMSFHVRSITFVRALLLLACGCVAAPAGAQTYKVGSFTKTAGTAVAFSTSQTASVAAALTVATPVITPGGTNRILVVGLSSDGALTALTVKFGGVALSLVPGSSGTNGATHTEMWFLVAPSTTGATVVATWTTTARTVVMGAVAFNNVDQNVGPQSGTFATGTSTAPAVTIVSEPGDMTLAIAGKLTNLGAEPVTSRWHDVSRANQKGGGTSKPGAATVTNTWTASATSTVWSTSGVNIKQLGGQTNIVAHGLGATPTALVLWSSGSTTGTGFANSFWQSFGVTDGTTPRAVGTGSLTGVASGSSTASRRASAKGITFIKWGQIPLAEADVTWDGTNFTLTWTMNNATAYVIHYMVMSVVTAKVVDWTAPAGTGVKSVAVGWQPNVLINFGDSDTSFPSNIFNADFMFGVADSGGDTWANGFEVDGFSFNSPAYRAQRTDACLEQTSVDGTLAQRMNATCTVTATGFDANFITNADGAVHIFTLALAGLNFRAGSFNKLTSAVTTPALVPGQVAAKNAGAVATTAPAQAFPANSTTGNLIVVNISYDGPRTLNTPTDNKGNTYILANPAVGTIDWGPGSNYHTATYYASNITGGVGAVAITATLSGAATSGFELYQFEFSGVSTVSPLDQVSSQIGTCPSTCGINSGAKTTTQANELIYGYGARQNGVITKGGTFLPAYSSFDSNIAEGKVVGPVGSYSADFTDTTGVAENWVAEMVTFKGNLQTVTGLGFQPTALFLSSFLDITRAAPTGTARLAMGASDGTTEGTAGITNNQGAATTSVQNFDKTDKIFLKADNNTSTIDAEADLASMDVDGFSLNWTANDAVATEILWMAFGPMNVTEVKLISFDATRYNRGVLLQWKTGYEIDNLGFNLYREVNGVRTRVNASLIAGSGLMAGQGTAVNAVQVYARWDLDAAATSGDAVYWLEDLDFSGKSTMHGPITPLVGVLDAPMPNVAQSSDLNEIGRSTKIRKVFLEHGEAELGRTRRAWKAQPASQTDMQWTLAGQAAVKIGIRAPGWYRVPQVDLIAAGLDPRADPRRLRLFVDGVEQAMRVTGEVDGRFDSGDAIEFYATGVDTPYTDTRVYWLAAGVERGQRINVTGSAAVGAGAKLASKSFWLTAHRKDRNVFFAALKNGDTENWFGPLVSEEPTDLTIVADNIDRAAGAAQLEVTLQGVTSNPDANGDHSVGVLVNGTAVGEMTFDGQEDAVHTFAVPTSVLVDGENAVTLIARGGEADYALVDVIRLGYWHTYRADADLLRFTVDAAGPVTIGGFANPAIRVVDITDTAATTELLGTIRSESGGLSSVTVRVQGQGPRTLLAFSDATTAAPASIEPNHPSTWHARTQAHNWIAISHADFIEQVKPLAKLREQQGYRTALIDVEDLYDEFSFGEKTPQALKDFLQFAKANWREGPRFVVLVGDATIDPRDYAELGDADFVPTKQVPMTVVALEAASDDWFVDFNGDGLPDVPIGRLSVRTADQAGAIVGKIVSYDENSQEPWTKSVLLVADQNGDTVNFEHYSTDLGELLPAGYTGQQVFRGVLGDEFAHQDLINGVNAGQLIVNYVGHGSTRLWGGNGELLTTEDVASSLRNASRLPFVVAMNCLNGAFNAIWDEESLAEAWLRAADGGAVAAWASTSVTPAATQAAVNRELFRLIFQGAYATLGEAVVAAKRVVSSQDLRRSWIFFGDPAMRLSGTPLPVTASSRPSPTPVATIVRSATRPGTAGTTSASDVNINAVLDARGEPVRLMDFNGDGRADMLLYAAASGRWAGVFNDATGISARAGSWGPAWQVVAANLNGDSRTDLIFYKRDTSEWIQALTTGDGSFSVTRGTLPGGSPHMRLSIGDFDGDHRDDVLLYDPDSGAWTVGLNDGYGGFTSRRGTWPSGLRIQIADFNRDGLSDAFGYDAVTGRGSLMLNSPDGRSETTTSDWGREWRVTVANLGGKTRTDLLFYNPRTGAWQAAMNDGLGHFAIRTGTWAPGLEIHATDLDGDGRDDVFGYNPVSGEWLIAMNPKSGQFPAVAGGSWTPGLAIATGDVNADGRDDVVLYDSGTGIWFEGMTVSPGVFAFGSGTWLPGASLIGR